MLVSCFLFAFVWQWTDSFYTSMFLSNNAILEPLHYLSDFILPDSMYTDFFLRIRGNMAVEMASLGDGFNFLYVRMNSAATGTHGAGPPMALLQSMISTGVLIGIAPVIIIYLFAQRFFVESIGQSGIKM
jgi:multiple sugar transport system permease protein